ESMGDALRVTLVATGIGSQSMSMPVKPTVKLVEARESESEANNDEIERPMATHADNRAKVVEKEGNYDLDYLDIPAFLRRQAD
ncbi:MAG: cell division protein FtsZ, partial [Gammaproteobacteria bacterium]|nr:cell division protein FtsZ [Gammaproteobacteria bacterium]